MGKRVRARRGSAAADVSSLRLTSLLHPPVGCPVCTWVPDVWPFPFPLKAGFCVAVSRPSVRSGCTVLSPHRRSALGSSVTSVQGPAVPLHTLHLTVPDARESGPGPWHDAFPKLLGLQLPRPFVSVRLMPRRGMVTVGHVARPCK